MKTTKEIAKTLRRYLLEDIMPFWDERCIDKENGGYQISFDREGNPTDRDKYIWFQARQTYIYARLHNKIDSSRGWREKAAWGYRYLTEQAYVGDGRFNYHLDVSGNVKSGTISVFADCFAIEGISEYLLTGGCADKAGMALLNTCYDALERNILDPEFKDIYENTWSETYIWHDLYLTALSAAVTASETLGDRTNLLMDYCLNKILNWFAKDEYKLVFEAVTRDNEVCLEDAYGRFINPGHTLESMWFCINAGRRRNNSDVINRAAKIMKWAAKIGIDREYGGVFSYLDATGKEPEAIDWYKETNSLWDDKVWWANSESLCAFAVGYKTTTDPYYLKVFQNLYTFCMAHFADKEYGEWYERLHRDGSVKVSDKGTPWKCAYHLVRALIMIILEFDE